jgi:hypothetical protein
VPHLLAGLERAAGPQSICAMNHAPQPNDAPQEPLLDARVQALLALRDELNALNARLEYVALMLRLARSSSTQ